MPTELLVERPSATGGCASCGTATSGCSATSCCTADMQTLRATVRALRSRVVRFSDGRRNPAAAEKKSTRGESNPGPREVHGRLRAPESTSKAPVAVSMRCVPLHAA
ncbi:unnamed protein product [Lampetra fluviatilis]